MPLNNRQSGGILQNIDKALARCYADLPEGDYILSSSEV